MYSFHVRSTLWQTVLFIVCTVPFWTSNVIRMISWIPLLGRNGLVNDGLLALGVVDQPVELNLLNTYTALVLPYTVLNLPVCTLVLVSFFQSIPRDLENAAMIDGCTRLGALWHVVVPLSRTGILIGSIFIVTIVMGDFVTVGVMGGQQIASVGKVIQTQAGVLQFPAAAANAVVLLAMVLLMIVALTRLVDLRKTGAVSQGALDDAQAAADETEFTVTVRGLVEVHEIHVNFRPRNFTVVLSV